MKVIIGSRGSTLALKQSEEVKSVLKQAYPHFDIDIEVIHTKGDKILDKPLNQIGDKGLFTQEIEEKLLNDEIDLAVHSMKDMPSVLPDGLMFAGTLEAQDHRDCLVFNHLYTSLNELPQGAVVGTGSPRRRTQLLKHRPDLNIVGIRGNVETRLRKMKEENMDAIVLASAGLKRLGKENIIGEYLDESVMVPACNQGILALEVKEGSWLLPYLEKIENKASTKRMELERLYLETVGGSCHMPIGCHVECVHEGIEVNCVLGNEEETCLYTHHEVISDHYQQRIKEIANMLKEKVENHG